MSKRIGSEPSSHVPSLMDWRGFNQLKEIMGILEKHKEQFDVIVDVFGGSGKVLLNVPEEWRKMKIYNDLNEDLYKTFKALQDQKKRYQLSRKLRIAFQHYDAFQEMKHRAFESDVDTAFKVIYLQTYSFMGDGTTFGRYFKGYKRKKFRLDDFVYVRDWIIENKDFRELMDKYNKPRVFFYLDPPYLSSGKKYRNKFTMQDLKDLKGKMDLHHGSYLLNLSTFDSGMGEIFGTPNKVIEYANPLTEYGKGRWGCGYWLKLSA